MRRYTSLRPAQRPDDEATARAALRQASLALDPGFIVPPLPF